VVGLCGSCWFTRIDCPAEAVVVEIIYVVHALVELVHDQVDVGPSHREFKIFERPLHVCFCAVAKVVGVVVLECLEKLVQGEWSFDEVLLFAWGVAHALSDSSCERVFIYVPHVVIRRLWTDSKVVHCSVQKHALSCTELVLFSNIDVSPRVVVGSSMCKELVYCQHTVSIGIIFIEESVCLLFGSEETEPHKHCLELPSLNDHDVFVHAIVVFGPLHLSLKHV